MRYSLCRATAEPYRDAVDDACLLVVPAPLFVLAGGPATAVVSDTSRWAEAKLSETRALCVAGEQMIIVYRMRATKLGAGS